MKYDNNQHYLCWHNGRKKAQKTQNYKWHVFYTWSFFCAFCDFLRLVSNFYRKLNLDCVLSVNRMDAHGKVKN